MQAIFIIPSSLSLEMTGYCEICVALWVDRNLLDSHSWWGCWHPISYFSCEKHHLSVKCWQLFLWHFASVHSMPSYLLPHSFLSNKQISFIAERKFDYVQNSILLSCLITCLNDFNILNRRNDLCKASLRYQRYQSLAVFWPQFQHMISYYTFRGCIS